jgi:hypothetical protein
MNFNQNVSKVLEEYYNVDRKVSKETLELITWYIYQLEENRHHDLYVIAKILPEKYIKPFVSYFDGDTIKCPKKEHYLDLRLSAICFFLKKIQGWNWQQIKNFLCIPEKDLEVFSSISLGNKINKISVSLNSDLKNILNNTEFKEDKKIQEMFKDYLN